MRCLSEIKNKKILLIVAHPDDETLWFYQSIQKLKTNNVIVVFCLTQTGETRRGKELEALGKRIGITIIFGNCEDTGFDKLLNTKEVENAFLQAFSMGQYDFAITHPPHGGEKPHPHHLQLHRIVKRICVNTSMKYGFFCEQNLFCFSLSEKKYYLSFTNKKFIIRHVLQGKNYFRKDFDKIFFLLQSVLEVLFNFKMYIGYQTVVDLSEKQAILEIFESQKDVLHSYSAFDSEAEFLFVEHENKI